MKRLNEKKLLVFSFSCLPKDEKNFTEMRQITEKKNARRTYMDVEYNSKKRTLENLAKI